MILRCEQYSATGYIPWYMRTDRTFRSEMISEGPSNLRIQSAWFQNFHLPVKLLEARSFRVLHSSSSADDVSKSIVLADIPIIVCNPVSTPLPTLLSSNNSLSLYLDNPNAVLVVSSSSYAAQFAQHIKSLYKSAPTTLFIDPDRALLALRTLRTSPVSSAAVQQYQDGFAGSKISTLTETISDKLSLHGSPSTVIAELHLQTAASLIRSSLNACRSVLQQTENEAVMVHEAISMMRNRMEELRVKLIPQIFGSPNKLDSEEYTVHDAVASSRKDLEAMMDTFVWWKLPWKVDDMRETMSATIHKVWCKDLERKVRTPEFITELHMLMTLHPTANISLRPACDVTALFHGIKSSISIFRVVFQYHSFTCIRKHNLTADRQSCISSQSHLAHSTSVLEATAA